MTYSLTLSPPKPPFNNMNVAGGGGEVTRLNKVIYLEQSSSVSAVCGENKLSPLEICNSRLSFLARIKEGIRDLQ